MLPLVDTMNVPEEAPIRLSLLPALPQFATISGLAKALEQGTQEKLDTVDEKAWETKLNQEAEGLGEKS